MSGRAVILVVDATDITGAELCSDLQDRLAGLADVKLVHGADEAVRAADSIHAAGGFVPLALVDLDFDRSIEARDAEMDGTGSSSITSVGPSI